MTATEYGNKNCLEIVQEDFEITGNEKEAENTVKKFVTHECFQSVVADIWSGEDHDLKVWEYYTYLFVCILMSPILLFLYFPYYVTKYFLN